ncbi:MAG: SDR family NAD(P)-dependent oxidoreductase, partial [Actinomycetota bacterium]
MRPIEGMSILITGGGSGLGEGMARHFAGLGALVTISGRRADKVVAVADSIGSQCCAVVGDVTRAEDRQAMVDAALDHGGGSIDTLVNNACNMYRGPLAEFDEDELLQVFHSNVVAGVMLTQA